MKIFLSIGGIILAAASGVSVANVSAHTTAATSSARSADCAEVAGALPANCVIDISKMNPAGLLVDKYSYMAQPYSFYYFHHMDRLAFRTDWVRKGSDTYPLKEPTKQFSLKYFLRAATIRSMTIFAGTLSRGFSFSTTIRSCLKSTSMERARIQGSCLSPSENRLSRF